jgi:hypothetical protein
MSSELNETDSLTERFLEGLKQYNLTYEEIKQWKYCGGNKTFGKLNDFKLCFPSGDLPTKSNVCMCGHDIKYNYYITNGSDILILGSCCIKKFIPKHKKTCEKCGAFHRNRIINLCNGCRDDIIIPTKCDNCEVLHRRKDNLCKECRRIEDSLLNTCSRCAFRSKEIIGDFCDECIKQRKQEEIEREKRRVWLNSITDKTCEQCNTKIKNAYTLCYKCLSKNKTSKCRRCFMNIDPIYTTCYKCRYP